MESKYIAGIIVGFIAVIIGITFYASDAVSGNIGLMTKTTSVNNKTVTLPAVSTVGELSTCGQRVLSIAITNSSGGELLTSSNYTTGQKVSTSDGYLVSTITPTATSLYGGQSVNVTCTYEPRGYVNDSGSRGIINIIAIFMVILIIVSASPDLREWVKGFGK